MSEVHGDDSDLRREGVFGELMFGAYDDQGLDEVPGATHWHEIPAVDAAEKWDELRAWVEQLQGRFSHLDHHVIPRCWWQHNEHVEVLSALRDHECSSFAETAPSTAPIDWFRALRDVTTLLRAWSGELSCGAAHSDPPNHSNPPMEEEWEHFVRADVENRQQGEIDRSSRAE
jgi:hypothetical protein